MFSWTLTVTSTQASRIKLVKFLLLDVNVAVWDFMNCTYIEILVYAHREL